MNRRNPIASILVLVIGLLSMAVAPLSAEACSACFGDPNSEVTRGIAWAIIFLGAIVLSVLGCVGGFFVFIARRAAATPGPHDTFGETPNSNQ
ncbi:MAG: MFS family permease [Candidatus Binatia bacterium]|jgi:MFS family permease